MKSLIYFSFHYCSDHERVTQIREAWLSQDNSEATGRWDDKHFMTILEAQGQPGVYPYIDSLRKDTDVTVVLIGEQTADSPFVAYELEKSIQEKQPILAIHMRGLTNKKGVPSPKGNNPLEAVTINKDGKEVPLSDVYPTYDWINDDGAANLYSWVEQVKQS